MIHDAIGQVLKRFIVATGAAPGASAAVAGWRGGQWRRARGVAGAHTRADLRPVTTESIYDLASLTKPVFAALLARWIRSGAGAWDAALGELLPAAGGTASEGATVAQLASHRAGLVAHLRLDAYREGPPPDPTAWLVRCASARRAECDGPLPASGFAPVYSDLGYLLLGHALGEGAGRPLDELVAREVTGPLGLGGAGPSLALGSARQLSAGLGGDWSRRVVPTEVVPERGGELRGVVHDDNAWELVGRGLAGHAGLFGTATAVLELGVAIVDALHGRRAEWLTAAEANELVRPRPAGSLRLGFDGRADEGSSAGAGFGPNAFGHLGFTGTSLWCEPDSGLVVVLLTNRVSPSRDNIRIRSVRPDAHSALAGLAAGL